MRNNTHSEAKLLEELLKTKAHLGTKSWNKNLSQAILGSRNTIHIFNLEYTILCLKQIFKVLQDIKNKNGHILFVNTQDEYSEIIKTVAIYSNQSYVNQRWIGGTLTNWKLVSESLFLYKRFSSQFDIFLIKHNIQIPAYQKAKKRYEGLSRSNANSISNEIGKIISSQNANPEYLPDLIILTNPDQNAIVIQEAKIFKIPLVAFTDTNTNTKDIDYIIPGNSKSISFIYYCLNLMVILLRKGK